MTVIPDLDNAEELQKFLDAIDGPEVLRELLDGPGMDDARIEEFVEAAGPTRILDRVFALMGERFVPERAKDEAGIVQWNVRTPSGVFTYHVEIRDGAAKGERGAYSGANVSLKISVPDLLRVCAGRLNAVTAFTSGKIQLTGDMMFGAKLSGWFDY
ncbi:SCP2 sterol-binding domain-containing protein [Actinomadura sp. 9N407]|uniref:SCP2 sterol-binding domain-containing protein n=1 Tax=Actinomadura sp. 9N407 TaxID=3375154 RepID=UPI0037A1B5CB